MTALGILASLLVAGFAGATYYFVQQIRTFPSVSHEAPFTDAAVAAEYELEGRRTPADFGFPTYHDEAYPSHPAPLTLRGWWMPARTPAATRAVVFVHGRWSNRLKPLKYLPLVSEAGLRTTHAVFLPDLRNAGTSDAGETAMGWAYADDLASTLEHLHVAHGIRRVVLYAFSMGAMAAVLLAGDASLRARLAASGVAIERAVLDSPLANVAGSIAARGVRDGLPAALVQSALWRFDASIGGRLGRMHLGPLLADVPFPVLVAQGEADTTTPAALLRAEEPAFGPNVQTVYYPGAAHVRLLTNPAHGAAYRVRTLAFLRAAR